MERSTLKNGLINFLALLAIGAAGFAVARYSNSLAGQVGAIVVGLGTLVAAVSWFQTRLEERERMEKLELDELSRSKGGSALFESTAAEAFPARRAREQFERFFVPGFTGLLLLLEALAAFLLWRGLSKIAALPELQQSGVAMGLFLVFFLVLFILGRFSATIARLESHRLLRPSASWLLLGAYASLASGIGLLGVWAGFPRADFIVACILSGLLGLIAFETLIALILEIYRPRVKGKIERPLYDSRLVGLLGQPEGLITTAAQALDYQFGFKVSETWFYRFLEKRLAWLILLQAAVLFASTSLVFIEPGEQGLLEHFGRPPEGRTLLAPGAHLKWPWPIDKVYRYRTEQIQSFTVGPAPGASVTNAAVLLWSVAHPPEENFLVANRGPGFAESTNAPPVSLLTVSIPVQFQISNLLDWAYNHQNSSNLLANIATREVVRYFVSADLDEVMSRSRAEGAEELRRRIQAETDRQRLGARIVFVGLQDIHPPVKVAPDYEKVIAAIHQKQAKILNAEADEIKTNALASAAATNIINVALATRTNLEIDAFARAAAFTNQIPAYAAAPSVYLERARLEMLARATANQRKIILLTTNTQDVVIYDLQQKIRPDLLENLSVAPSRVNH